MGLFRSRNSEGGNGRREELEEDNFGLDTPPSTMSRRRFVGTLAGLFTAATFQTLGLAEAHAEPRTPAQEQFNREVEVLLEAAKIELASIESVTDLDFETVKELIDKINLVLLRISKKITRGYNFYGEGFYDKLNPEYQLLNGMRGKYQTEVVRIVDYLVDEYSLNIQQNPEGNYYYLESYGDGSIGINYETKREGISATNHFITISPDGTVENDFRNSQG